MIRAARYIVPLLILVALTVAFWQSGEQDIERQLWHYRNLGKAFYENPTTQYEAVEQFKSALDMAPDSARERLNWGLSLLRAGQPEEGIAELRKVQEQAPELPHTWFNIGIYLKKKADYPGALKQLQQMAELVPDEPITHYNLGVLHRLTGNPEQALKEFEISAALDPNLAGPHFQLYNGYRAAGRTEEATAEFKAFNELKKRQAGAAIPEDLEWSFFSEIYDVIEPREPEVPALAELKFKSTTLKGALSGQPKGALTLDADANGTVDVLAWSDSQALLFSGESDSGKPAGLDDLKQVLSISPGDVNNDGFPDLCVLTETGPVLYTNQDGQFSGAGTSLTEGSFRKAVWHDFDHDTDIDLFLLGSKSLLLRNNGSAGFSDHTERFPFVEGDALDGVSIDLVKDTNGSDFVVTYNDRPTVLYRDKLGGRYESINLAQIPPRSEGLLAADLNNDGWTDLLAAGNNPSLLLLNLEGHFEMTSLAIGSGKDICLADLGNRGWIDLVRGQVAFANLGLGRFGTGQGLGESPPVVATVSADFDSDGRVDLAALRTDGSVSRLMNEVETNNRWTQIVLVGVKNPRLALGAEVEIKTGLLYQKKIYEGLPLHVGLGAYDGMDTVRITWPNGLIQNELKQPVKEVVTFKEAQRLSGSCPMIFTWNGKEFEFITDVLGVAPLGASSGDGEYFPVDHDEYVSISSGSLVEKDNTYEIRITEELREISYLDQIRLIAVDQPEDMTVYTNEKFKGPPFPEFRLFGVKERNYPVSAVDDRGQDVLSKVVKLDRTYPDSFERDYSGVAEPHFIEIEFGPELSSDDPSVLVLSGWVDWADGSTFLRSVQESGGLVMPYLQVLNEEGEWQTVIEDMGLPAGKPKTIVVDLTDKFLSQSRKVRIGTSLCVYWDEIFLSGETESPSVQLREVAVNEATLSFRGFSTPVIHPERKQPEAFDYGRWMPISMWNPTPGNYTRYGEVAELLDSVDDRLVIMGSGDELKMLFDAGSLPAVPDGFKRTFLLHVDGWAKDGDLNTAHSVSVNPLPFHGMSRYPYPADESFPDDAEHQLYLEEYNTRPALRLIRPLSARTR